MFRASEYTLKDNVTFGAHTPKINSSIERLTLDKFYGEHWKAIVDQMPDLKQLRLCHINSKTGYDMSHLLKL